MPTILNQSDLKDRVTDSIANIVQNTSNTVLAIKKNIAEINKLTIIIPVYNEGRTINLLLDRVKEVKLINSIGKEIIIVNDCSTDDTAIVLQKYIAGNTDINITYLAHEKNAGKGAAIHTGIRY